MTELLNQSGWTLFSSPNRINSVLIDIDILKSPSQFLFWIFSFYFINIWPPEHLNIAEAWADEGETNISGYYEFMMRQTFTV